MGLVYISGGGIETESANKRDRPKKRQMKMEANTERDMSKWEKR